MTVSERCEETLEGRDGPASLACPERIDGEGEGVLDRVRSRKLGLRDGVRDTFVGLALGLGLSLSPYTCSRSSLTTGEAGRSIETGSRLDCCDS